MIASAIKTNLKRLPQAVYMLNKVLNQSADILNNKYQNANYGTITSIIEKKIYKCFPWKNNSPKHKMLDNLWYMELPHRIIQKD